MEISLMAFSLLALEIVWNTCGLSPRAVARGESAECVALRRLAPPCAPPPRPSNRPIGAHQPTGTASTWVGGWVGALDASQRPCSALPRPAALAYSYDTCHVEAYDLMYGMNLPTRQTQLKAPEADRKGPASTLFQCGYWLRTHLRRPCHCSCVARRAGREPKLLRLARLTPR